MKTPNFTFEIKGITLNMDEMTAVHQQYEIYCTAEYLMENYHLDEEQALEHAAEIRRRMDKYSMDENEAIIEVVGYADEDE